MVDASITIPGAESLRQDCREICQNTKSGGGVSSEGSYLIVYFELLLTRQQSAKTAEYDQN